MSAVLNMPGTLMAVFHIADQVADVFNGPVPEGRPALSGMATLMALRRLQGSTRFPFFFWTTADLPPTSCMSP